MQAGKPSRTAWAAASHRAAHQILEGGRIFTDPLAVKILGGDAEAIARDAAEDPSRPSRRAMRNFIAARTRFAEDALAAAVADGTSQLVVLGAGLDTFAYRNPYGVRLRVLEVDHPATQEWKRGLLDAAGIAAPETLTFAPVDFERQSLSEGLAAAGFESTRQTFFTWLGVVPYLTKEAVWATLGFIASVGGGAHVVFDYSDPPETLPPDLREYHEVRAARVREFGEEWLSYFEAEELQTKLMALGFLEVGDFGPVQIAERHFPERAALARSRGNRGGHVLRASKKA
jgi:methyltransferase (TIGR00027 family)